MPRPSFERDADKNGTDQEKHGVAFAHKIMQKITGPQNAQLNITVDKVEMVPDVDDQLFAMPVKP